MNLIGKWKVKELPVYPEPGKMIFVAVEELPKYITDEDLLNDYMQQASFIYEFCEDGTVETMMPIPEEMMEKAKEQGAKIRITTVCLTLPCGRKKTVRSSMIQR